MKYKDRIYAILVSLCLLALAINAYRRFYKIETLDRKMDKVLHALEELKK